MTVEWLAHIHARYDVNPWVFLTLYAVHLPPCWYGVWRIAAALRQRNHTSLRRWGIFVGAMVVIPYSYVLIAGRHLPWWVYPAVACLLALSAWEIVVKARKLSRRTPLACAVPRPGVEYDGNETVSREKDS